MPHFEGRDPDGNDIAFVNHQEAVSQAVIDQCQRIAEIGTEEHDKFVQGLREGRYPYQEKIVKENVTGALLMAMMRDHGSGEIAYNEQDLRELSETYTVFFEVLEHRFSAKLVRKDEVLYDESKDAR
ncbi:MAG: hypothetical protein ABIH23_05975 [bacterium]